MGVVQHGLGHALADRFAAGKVDDRVELVGAQGGIDVSREPDVALMQKRERVSAWERPRSRAANNNKKTRFLLTLTNFMLPALSPASSFIRSNTASKLLSRLSNTVAV